MQTNERTAALRKWAAPWEVAACVQKKYTCLHHIFEVRRTLISEQNIVKDAANKRKDSCATKMGGTVGGGGLCPKKIHLFEPH